MTKIIQIISHRGELIGLGEDGNLYDFFDQLSSVENNMEIIDYNVWKKREVSFYKEK